MMAFSPITLGDVAQPDSEEVFPVLIIKLSVPYLHRIYYNSCGLSLVNAKYNAIIATQKSK